MCAVGARKKSRRAHKAEQRRQASTCSFSSWAASGQAQEGAASELSLEELQKRRKRNKQYSKDSYSRKKERSSDADASPVELGGEAAYGRTKTGKPRIASKAARASAKSRAVAKVLGALESVGDEAQQAQLLKDVSERKETVAKAAGYYPSEEVETALFEQGQHKKMPKRATSTESAGVSDDRRQHMGHHHRSRHWRPAPRQRCCRRACVMFVLV